ncbi:hypothetical protein AV654_17930 [Paenibacillus elgii]|uniref:HTH cro/C1-type domain-containing protein n=1 Tax=Paenibacillus elgii TaxID=189691 RepID=A0A161S451_9BACL|nr:helix-turn-helix transcriptional regulator [Paenibacillus elgii]KZE79349.1 hypothetical protein AV654_17930 [Paenibacillus elgii]
MSPREISLRTARLLSGYTLKEAAAHAGISVSVLSEFEKKSWETTLNVAISLLELYQVSVDVVNFSEKSNNLKRNSQAI